ncbi:hypothetical protein Hanom_Chr17g01581491 [Helianthus anomalus]
MFLNQQSPVIIFLCTLIISTTLQIVTSDQPTTIYELLQLNGLPIGLLPEGVTDFEYDESGRFEVHLDQACNAKFEDELHYDQNVSRNENAGQQPVNKSQRSNCRSTAVPVTI